MKSYYCDDGFDSYSKEKWQILLDFVLLKSNYIELNQLTAEEKIPYLLLSAQVNLPYNIQRIYRATHRFLLTPEIIKFLKNKSYSDFHNSKFEDPAIFENDTLLLGSITHEGYAIMLLEEAERQAFNEQGFSFWCKWDLNC